MAQCQFVVGATTVVFGWLHRGPNQQKRNNTDVYSGRVLLSGSGATTPLQQEASLAGLWREIAVRPIDASSGTGFVVDYNGVTDPSGTLTLADGTTVTAVLSAFTRGVWNVLDYQECDVEFTRVA